MLRKSFLLSLLILLAAGSTAFCGGLPFSEKEFKNPPVKYGGAPFWSWNDTLEPAELRAQVDEFKAGGLGGFFMHARVGLVTPYLSDEWFRAVRASVDQAKKNGMLAYMYDEDGYPSGYAGGLFAKKADPSLLLRVLIGFESKEPITPSHPAAGFQLVKIFSIKKDGNMIVEYTDITPKSGIGVTQPDGGRTLMYFFRQPGSRFMDNLNPASVKKFIEMTHEQYKKHIGKEFGKTVPAIFTDEPAYNYGTSVPGASSLPWTDALPATLKKKNGYDISAKLPLLFISGPGYQKVRLDFWTTTTEMYRDAYDKSFYDWGEKNNVAYTGHHFGEESFVSSIRWIGAPMPHYEYMQMPGMDHLGKNIKDLVVAKQVSSVAHQFSRPLVLTEIFGCSGADVSFEELKWMTDWHYALGANFLVQHLSLYSMRGARKRDYPPTLSWQQPWWKYYKILTSYQKRGTYLTSRGSYVADLLALNPVTSAWSIATPVDELAVEPLSKQFNSVVEALSAAQADYDIGDEIIISRHGKVSGKKFIVNKMSYTAVLIPPGTTLRTSTVSLLKTFIANGGNVVMLEPAPSLVDAEKPLSLPGAIKTASLDDALAQLASHMPNRILLSESKGDMSKLFVMQKTVGRDRFVFFANTDLENSSDLTAALPVCGSIKMLDLFSGASKEYPAKKQGAKCAVRLHFEPAGSAALIVTPDKQPKAGAPVFAPDIARSEDIPAPWKIAKQDMNSLTLDYFDYRIEGAADWTTRAPFFEVRDALRKAGTGRKFELRYTFGIAFEPKDAKRLFIALEQPGIYKININGKDVSFSDRGWWTDKAFRLMDIRDAAVKGKNTIVLSGTYRIQLLPGNVDFEPDGVEPESIYVVGDFSVKSGDGGYELRPPVTEAEYSNLSMRGFPFYAGAVTLSRDVRITPQKGEKVFIEFEGLESTVTRVSVNGKEAGIIAFHPHRLDITKFVKNGENRIDIELIGSVRNLLGPHHTILKELFYTSPRDFEDNTFKKYNFVPFGITGKAKISYAR